MELNCFQKMSHCHKILNFVLIFVNFFSNWSNFQNSHFIEIQFLDVTDYFKNFTDAKMSTDTIIMELRL